MHHSKEGKKKYLPIECTISKFTSTQGTRERDTKQRSTLNTKRLMSQDDPSLMTT